MHNSVTLVVTFVILTSIYAGNSYGEFAPREPIAKKTTNGINRYGVLIKSENP